MSTAAPTPPAVEPEYTFSVDDKGVVLHWQGQTFQIEAVDLQAEGWHIPLDCDPCERTHLADVDLDAVTETLRRWHDEQSGHPGAFKVCDRPPCQSLRTDLELL